VKNSSPSTGKTRAAKPRPFDSARKSATSSAKPAATAGIAARQLAVTLISAVMAEKRALDDVFAASMANRAFAGIEPRDRAFARLIAGTVLRRHGELTAVVNTFIDKPLPERRGRLWPILLSGAAQLLVLDTPAHAAISSAVDQCRLDRDAGRFDKLVNAVLRRVAERGAALLARQDAAAANIPAWLYARWQRNYGDATARAIAEASLREAPLDLSVKADAAGWAAKVGGIVLPTGSVRLAAHGRIEDMPGYAEGAWWVQDAAAALPVRLLGGVSGREVADLCAAPGGKTAELAAQGAIVTSVEASHRRLKRIEENLARLQLSATCVAADVTAWSPGRTFDAVLLDAPCTATGTIRRHPDILHLKREADIAALAAVQSQLLANAARLTAPGGTLVYCTCSLEPEEGPERIAEFLNANPGFTRQPLQPGEFGLAEQWLTADGDLRTLPLHMALETPGYSGMDGFYAARLLRHA
jgi:16S rRNA (cytosine967-C5)-methyltransferase